MNILNKKVFFRSLTTLLLPLLLIVLAPHEALAEVEVMEIHYRPADQLAEQLRSHIDEDTVVTAYQQQIIVSGTAAQRQQVKTLLSALDKPLRQYRIQFRYGDGISTDQDRTNGSITITSNRNGNILSTTTVTRTYSTHGLSSGASYQLRVSEGLAARLTNSEQWQTFDVWFGTPAVTTYQLETGLWVSVRPADDGHVNLQIDSRQPSASDSTVSSHHQRATTQLSSSLRIPSHSWVTLGSIGRSQMTSTSGFTNHGLESIKSTVRDIQLEVYVEELDSE